MNDFTKEELIEIVDATHHMRKQGIETTHDLSYQVELKAQYMIDNYCEHTQEKWDSGEYKLCPDCRRISNDN